MARARVAHQSPSALVGRRVVEWLRRHYPDHGAKRIAKLFGCSPHTSQRWLCGLRPDNKHFDAMVELWGPAFLTHCYDWLGNAPWALRTNHDLIQIKDSIQRLIERREVLGDPALAEIEWGAAVLAEGGR